MTPLAYRYILLSLIGVGVIFLLHHPKRNITPLRLVTNESHLHPSSARHVEQITNEKSSKIDDPPRRPIMHTFFEPIEEKEKTGSKEINRGSGMSTPEAHAKLLEAWQNAWEEAGWTTRVLTLEDAMAHPKYEEVRESLGRGIFSEYDKLCFMRWFAMVSAGGGWMSDYDLFPLAENIPLNIMGKIADQKYHRYAPLRNINSSKWANNGGVPLPNDGKFTVYDNGGTAPSLLSGSKKDWDRVARGLIKLEEYHLEGFYSDMLALDDYDESYPQDIAKEYSVVWSLAHVMSGVRKIECENVWGRKNKFWAVHFSHYNVNDSLLRGVLEKGLGRDDRPQIAIDFLHDWKQQCAKGTKCFDGTLSNCY